MHHPFILTLHGAFKDEHTIYFVLELLQGGELFTHLRNRGKLCELDAKFYAAQVLIAFGHMHSKKIAYRDLKPENLVLDTDGYLKVVDFGLAKIVDCKTWTLCGTPDYLAPEIILNEGHNQAVDYWALGVLIFEMTSGLPPFYADDPMEVYEKILSAKMSMPSHFSKNLSDLIRKLCKIFQSKRLGNGKGGVSAIQKHKWFSTFDFQGLVKKELDVPIKPNISHPLDMSNFDEFSAGEESALQVLQSRTIYISVHFLSKTFVF
jgi:serine/threonine protein kinase